MPKIFEYLGIIIFFYPNEHEPVHVHASKGEYESRAEIEIIDSKITNIIIKNVRGREPLKGSDLDNLKIFLDSYGEIIVQKWIDYFVLHKSLSCEIIRKRIK